MDLGRVRALRSACTRGVGKMINQQLGVVLPGLASQNS